MAKFFDQNSSNASRALQIWLILIAKAHNRQTITYGMLADMMGFKGAGMLGGILDYIMKYCDQNQLPPLTVLVENKETGKPGSGLTTIADSNKDRLAVFDYNWFNVIPPTIEELREAHQR